MSGLSPSQLEKWTKGRWFHLCEPALLGSLAIDTRQIAKGDVFVALKTGSRNGHEFLPAALEAGAAAAIVDHPDVRLGLPQLVVENTLDALHAIAAGKRREFTAPLFAITGSCGKTSTKDLLALLLGGESVLSTRGNLNNYIGMPLTLSRLDPSVHRSAVVEIGISFKGEMRPLADIAAPDRGIVTCVAHAHLSGLGSLQGVAEEKSALLAGLGMDNCAYFPASCMRWDAFRRLGTRCIVTAAVNEGTPELPGPNYSLVRYQTFRSADSDCQDMLLFLPDGRSSIRVHVPELSPGMLSNAALAIVAAADMGVPVDAMCERIAQWQPTRMRGEIRRKGRLSFYVDCYNANPASMIDATRNFRSIFTRASHLYVLGCMNELGAESGNLHERLGESLGTVDPDASYCILGRESGELREGLLQAGVSKNRVVATESRDEVRHLLEDFQDRGGAVFVKGSRSYRMEEFVPEGDVVTKESVAC